MARLRGIRLLITTLAGLAFLPACDFTTRSLLGGQTQAAKPSTSQGPGLPSDPSAPAQLHYNVSQMDATLGWTIADDVPSSSGGAITTYSILPSLPLGLTLEPSTGIISGTPLTLSPSTTYTVTGANSAGETITSVIIAVNDVSPSALTYNLNPASYVLGQAISPNLPTAQGGAIVNYLISPALPAGLSLSLTTGVITGTPTVVAPSASYQVTAYNSGGYTNCALTLSISASVPLGLSYAQNALVLTKGVAMSNDVATLTPNASASYTISPSLPAGLTLDASSGTISGTPTIISPQKTYTVTASNVRGTAAAGLSITANDAPPFGLTYANNPIVSMVGTSVADSLFSQGGAVTSYSISPASLPAGLSFNVATGAVSGTPTSASASASYTVTAINSGGRANTTLSITINPLGLPPNPKGFTASVVSNSQIQLNWTAAGGSAAGYALAYQSGSSAPADCTSGTHLGSVTSFLLTGLSPATTYSMRLCSYDANLPAGLSGGVVAAATTPPVTPANPSAFTATAVSSTQINLSWVAGNLAASYVLAYQAGSSAPSNCSGASNIGSGTSYSVTGLTANTAYSFRLCSASAPGNAGPMLSGGVTASASTLSQPAPPNPTALTATVTQTSVTLNWTSGGGSTQNFWVVSAAGTTPPATCASAAATGLVSTYTFSSLSPGTAYAFRLCAVNGGVPPAVSSGATVIATTTMAPPPDPSGLLLTPSSTTISLSWNAAGGSTTNYLLASQPGSTPPANCSAGVPLGNVTQFTIKSLAPATNYAFRLCSENSAAPPDISSGVTATTTTTNPSVAVTNCNDSGAGSLRAAIAAINATVQPAVVSVDFSATLTKGMCFITLQSPLPPITHPAILDARSNQNIWPEPNTSAGIPVGTTLDPVYIGPGTSSQFFFLPKSAGSFNNVNGMYPGFWLDGSQLGNSGTGVTLASATSVLGFVFTNFSGIAVSVYETTGARVDTNWIGAYQGTFQKMTDPSSDLFGSLVSENAASNVDAVSLYLSNNSFVQNNHIVGFTHLGVQLTGGNSNTIRNNWVFNAVNDSFTGSLIPLPTSDATCFMVLNSTNAQISGNTLECASGSPIQIQGTSSTGAQINGNTFLEYLSSSPVPATYGSCSPHIIVQQPGTVPTVQNNNSCEVFVTSAADDMSAPPGTLRGAIAQVQQVIAANVSASSLYGATNARISFLIPNSAGNPFVTIHAVASLGIPPLVYSQSTWQTMATYTVVIDATTEPGYATAAASGKRLITLSGAGISVPQSNGILFQPGSGGVLLRGLVITGFLGWAIYENSSGGNTYVENFIGVDNTQENPAPNGGGILIGAGAQSYIAGNVISSNLASGVEIAHGWPVLEGNCIGVNQSGKALGNLGTGVNFEPTAWAASVGGNFSSWNGMVRPYMGQPNSISGNGGVGVYVSGLPPSATIITPWVTGNFIGYDPTGKTKIPNAGGNMVIDPNLITTLCTGTGTIYAPGMCPYSLSWFESANATY